MLKELLAEIRDDYLRLWSIARRVRANGAPSEMPLIERIFLRQMRGRAPQTDGHLDYLQQFSVDSLHRSTRPSLGVLPHKHHLPSQGAGTRQ